MWELQPMLDLAQQQQIVGYRHRGFWKCMDTMRDKEELEHMWQFNPLRKKRQRSSNPASFFVAKGS